jgi:hypothetical protein
MEREILEAAELLRSRTTVLAAMVETLDAVDTVRSRSLSRTAVLAAMVETLDAVDTVRSRSLSRMLRSAVDVGGAGWEIDIALLLVPCSAGVGAGGTAGAAA